MQGAEAGAGSSTTANSLPGSSAAGHSEAAGSLSPAPATSQAPAATDSATGQIKQKSDGESLEAARKAEKARREAKAGGGASKGQHAQGRGQQAEGKGQQAQAAAQTQPQQQVSEQWGALLQALWCAEQVVFCPTDLLPALVIGGNCRLVLSFALQA